MFSKKCLCSCFEMTFEHRLSEIEEQWIVTILRWLHSKNVPVTRKIILTVVEVLISFL